MKKILLYVCLALLFLSACSTKAKLAKADQAFEEGAYYKAADAYRKLQSKVAPADQERVRFRLGECYRISGKYKEAQTAYALMFRRRTPANEEVYLRYGQVLLAGGQPDKAKEQLLLYKKYVPDSPFADSLLLAVDQAKDSVKQDILYTVKAMDALNTRYSDYAPAYASGDYEILYFTSARKTGNRTSKKYDVTGESTSDIFSSAINRRGLWGRVEPVSEVLNTKFEDGAPAFNSAYNQLYFTRCGKVSREKRGCSIYLSERKDDQWNEPQKLPLADDSLTVAHPSLSEDGLTLYFASDLPAGYGGMDIWKVTRGGESDNFGEPINLGPQINTSGNEMFPFSHANGTLYFSSDGHPGIGGLDIFKATPADNSWLVENAGQPLNSPADDFSIIFERDNDRGYFSSNRKPGKGSDDIYAFAGAKKIVEYYFSTVVKDLKTGRLLPGAEVRLVGNNGSTLRRQTEENGTAEFRVNPATDYLAVASVKGYLNQKTRFSSDGWSENYTLHDTLWMVPTDKPIEIPNIFFDFAKATLTDDSRTALDSLVMIMNDNPTLIIELRAHTDSRGSEESNYVMSQQRAQAVVDYLVDHEIDPGRIEAVGYGEVQPRITDAGIARRYPFLRVNTKLDDKFINSLKDEQQQEDCHALNRRIEFQVLGDNYHGARGL